MRCLRWLTAWKMRQVNKSDKVHVKSKKRSELTASSRPESRGLHPVGALARPHRKGRLTTTERSKSRSSLRASLAKFLIWSHTVLRRPCVVAGIWSNDPAAAEAGAEAGSTVAPRYSSQNFSTRVMPRAGAERCGPKARLGIGSLAGGGIIEVV